MIVPGMFLVILFILISIFGNQMLISTTEEKENRTVEMLLTTVKTDTLITGKILSLMVLAALIQILSNCFASFGGLFGVWLEVAIA